MRSRLLVLGLTLLVSGCAHLDYVGESYTPTTHVDVYYQEKNVDRPYRVMGEVVATGDFFVSSRKIQEQLAQKARDKGADAVVLLGLEQYQAGETTSYDEHATESKDKKGRTHTSSSGSSSTSIEEKKRIRAIFIRYTPATASDPDTTN